MEYDWDHRNRLVAVAFYTSAGTLTKEVSYAYDAFQRLVAKTVDEDGDTTVDRSESWAYDGTQAVLHFDDGSLAHRNLWGPATDQLFADEDALGEVLWALTDHQGSVRDVADHDPSTDTTTVVNHRVYDSFGKLLSETDATIDTAHGYTARYFDQDTGLQWNLNRWLDPVARVWLSEDPIGFAGGDANLSRYVGNGPTYAVDPGGLAEFVFGPTITSELNRLHGLAAKKSWDRIYEWWNRPAPPQDPPVPPVSLPSGWRIRPIENPGYRLIGGTYGVDENHLEILIPAREMRGGIRFNPAPTADEIKENIDAALQDERIWRPLEAETIREAEALRQKRDFDESMRVNCVLPWWSGFVGPRGAPASSSPAASRVRAQMQARPKNLMTPGGPTRPSATTRVIAPPEVFHPRPVKPLDMVARMKRFLGPGPYTHKHPRLGTHDPSRFVSADGKRSIRYGNHEVGGKPTRHHYHEETWTYDFITDTMTVNTVTVRVPKK